MGLLINEIQGRSSYNSSKTYRFYNPTMYWPVDWYPNDPLDYGESISIDGCFYPDCITYDDATEHGVDCFGDCPAGDCFCWGNINGDGNLNILDIVPIINHIMGNSILTGDQYLAADVTGDVQMVPPVQVLPSSQYVDPQRQVPPGIVVSSVQSRTHVC